MNAWRLENACPKPLSLPGISRNLEFRSPEQVIFPKFPQPWEFSLPLRSFIPNISIDSEISRSEKVSFSKSISSFGKMQCPKPCFSQSLRKFGKSPARKSTFSRTIYTNRKTAINSAKLPKNQKGFRKIRIISERFFAQHSSSGF